MEDSNNKMSIYQLALRLVLLLSLALHIYNILPNTRAVTRNLLLGGPDPVLGGTVYSTKAFQKILENEFKNCSKIYNFEKKFLVKFKQIFKNFEKFLLIFHYFLQKTSD